MSSFKMWHWMKKGSGYVKRSRMAGLHTDRSLGKFSNSEISNEKPNNGSSSRTLKLTRRVLNEIRRTIGGSSAERGGALGGNRDSGEVTHFHFDDSAVTTGATYSPNADFLNRLFAESWNPNGINLLGFVHSHPASYKQPSHGDLIYAKRILDAIPELEGIYLPIVMSAADNDEFEFLPFRVSKSGEFVACDKVELQIVDEISPQRHQSPMFDPDETFRRVKNAYDLPRLAGSRVIYVGVGGAASFAEELARAGVGQHILIDPDVVSQTNIATQQVYRRDIGKPKVSVLADRIRDINPDALVISLPIKLDGIDDEDFGRLVSDAFGVQAPVRTLLCGLTDDFFVQARVNRLSLHFGIASLCAQVYWQGRGAEITLNVPGLTQACHRCMLSSRYDAFLSKQFRNNVTSDGTPIFSTSRLNALKGFIALAILHHGSEHERWGTMIERIGDRSLVQIRMDPDIGRSLGINVFDDTFGNEENRRAFFDEAIWLPQKPDTPSNGFPTCPDCGGTGDLTTSTGSFKDTRRFENEVV